jgi:hypothetical protein
MTRYLVFILLFLIWPSVLNAQYGSFGVTDARSLGMGNTYNATSFDLYAVGKSPALLAKSDAPCKVTFIFPNITAQQYGITETLGAFDYYTSNKLKSEGLLTVNEDKILVAMENDGKMFADALIGFFSASYHHSERIGSFALTMSDYMSGYAYIPDVVLDINYGTDIPDGNFNVENLLFKASWIRTYSLSYSRYIYKDRSLHRNNPGFFKSILGGISVKYVSAYAYTDINLSVNAYYTSATQNLSGTYDVSARHSFSPDLATIDPFSDEIRKPPGFLRIEPAGSGYAFDIGAAAELRKGWTVALSATDLGRIKWKGLAANSEFSGNVDFSGVLDEQTLDSLAVDLRLDKERYEGFTSAMPMAIRAGVSLRFEEMFKRFPGELLVGLDYNQGLNKEPSNYTAARFSVGFHYRPAPKTPIILGGYTIDFLGIGRGAFGLGYATWFVDVYVSTIDLFSMFNSDDRFSVSLVARWKILCGRQKNKGPDCF